MMSSDKKFIFSITPSFLVDDVAIGNLLFDDGASHENYGSREALMQFLSNLSFVWV